MRRNRKIPKKMSVVATNTMRFGAIIVIFFVMVILNLLSSSSCKQLLKRQGELERELVKLEDSRLRESTRWEEMKTPEKVEAALMRHGLAMRPPLAKQTVQMRGDGTPYPGQLSLARARQLMPVSTMLASDKPRKVNTTVRPQYRRSRSR